MSARLATAFELRAETAAVDRVSHLGHEPLAREVTSHVEYADCPLRPQAIVPQRDGAGFHPQTLRAELVVTPFRQIGGSGERGNDFAHRATELLLHRGVRRLRGARQLVELYAAVR